MREKGSITEEETQVSGSDYHAYFVCYLCTSVGERYCTCYCNLVLIAPLIHGRNQQLALASQLPWHTRIRRKVTTCSNSTFHVGFSTRILIQGIVKNKRDHMAYTAPYE